MDLLKLILAGRQKAIVALLVAGALSLLSLVGVDGDMTVKDALTALGNGAVTGLAVWAQANKK